MAKTDVPEGSSLTNTTYWLQIAAKGSNADIATITSAVNTWLATHVTQPTTPAIDDTLSITGAAADAAKTGLMIAPIYNNTTTYNLGDIVNYNGSLYRCISTITTAEDWDNNHWIATKMSDEVSDLKSAVGSNAFALDEHILKPIKYATLSSDLAVTFSSPESQLDTDYVSGLIPLPETLDGKITHNGNGYSSSRAIVFYNSAKAPVGSATQNGYNLIETTIPDGSAFFRLRRGGGSASQVLQASFNLSAAEKANYLRTLIHFEPDLYIYDFDAPDIFTMEHTEISTSTGEDTYSSASGYSGTDFILLPEDIELIGTYAYTGSGRARVAFYDADKVFISAVYSNSKRLAATSIPEGAVYVRFGTHSTIPPASCIAVGLVKATKSNDEIIDMIRQALV